MALPVFSCLPLASRPVFYKFQTSNETQTNILKFNPGSFCSLTLTTLPLCSPVFFVSPELTRLTLTTIIKTRSLFTPHHLARPSIENMTVPTALRSRGHSEHPDRVDFLVDTFQRLSLPSGGSSPSIPSNVRGSLPHWAQLDRTVSNTSSLSDASIFLPRLYKRITLTLLSPLLRRF